MREGPPSRWCSGSAQSPLSPSGVCGPLCGAGGRGGGSTGAVFTLLGLRTARPSLITCPHRLSLLPADGSLLWWQGAVPVVRR